MVDKGQVKRVKNAATKFYWHDSLSCAAHGRSASVPVIPKLALVRSRWSTGWLEVDFAASLAQLTPSSGCMR